MKRILIVLMALLLATAAFATGGQEQQGPPVVLKGFYPPPFGDMSHKDAILADVNKMLSAKIGATIDITFVDWGNISSKLNTMLAANEPFDFTIGFALGDFATNMAKGLYIPIDDLLNKYGKTILKLTPPELWPAVTSQGKKYAIINVLPYAQKKGADFQQKLVEKYKFDYLKVKTPRDCEPFLEQIKKNEPDMYGILSFNNLLPWDQYRLDPITLDIAYDAVTKKIVRTYDMPEVLEQLKIAKEWYAKGYIPKDAELKKDNQAEIQTGKYAMWGANVATNGYSVKESNAYGMPTVSVVSGITLIRTGQINGVVTIISKTSQHKEKTMQFFDLLWSDKKIFNTLCYGQEGVDYDIVSGAGTDLPTLKTKEPMKWAFWHPWLAEMMVNQWPSNWNDAAALEEFRYNNANAPRSPVLGFVFDPTPVKDEVAQIAALIAESLFSDMTGSFNGTAEEHIASQKAAMGKLGYDKVFAEVQKQYEAWKKANNK